VQYLVAAVDKEYNSEARVGMVEALKDVAALCYESGDDYGTAPILAVSDADLSTMVACLTNAVTKSVERRTEVGNQFVAAAEGGELDQAAHESILDALQSEVDLAEFAVDGLGYLMKARGAAFLPVFQKIEQPVFEPLLRAGGATSNSLRLNALCVFVDAVEWCGAAAAVYVATILPTIASCLACDFPDLRQCSAYGLGIIAQVG